jgi:riboflavin-specific deaminase-like protein
MRRPFVTANFALSVDGRVSTRRYSPSTFSSPRDKRRLLEIRAQCDAVLAGARTVASDHMTMGLPAADLQAARKRRGWPPIPLRVIASNGGKLSATAKPFTSGLPAAVVFSTRRMTARTIQALAGVCDLWLHLADEVNLASMLMTLREEYRVKRLVCEGGPTLLRALLVAGLVDELQVTLCPLFFGGRKAPTLTGLAGDFLPASTHLHLVEILPLEGECFTRWRVK